ncbi:MAG: NAD(P)H-binding protein [Erythrobacter sp.]
MSEAARIALVGSTGLIGGRVIEAASASAAVRLVGLARRETPLPKGARMEMFVAEPAKWGEVMEAVRPRALICALGTTWNKAGKNEAAFRAVDQELVIASAEAALKAGASNMVMVSAAGADRTAKSRYFRIKGEVEGQLSGLGFKRIDILRPGLLKGPRPDDQRLAERLALLAAPLVDPLLMGSWRRLASIDARDVARAALSLAVRHAPGRFTHDNDAMRRMAREWQRSGKDN